METLRGFPCLPARGTPPAKLAGSPRDLNENKSRLPPDAEAGKRLAEVDALCTALQTSPGTVHTSKGQTVADTVQMDLYDGKLYTRMRDLNAVGRAAIRNGDLAAGLHEYTFHHLKRGGNPNPVPAPVPAPAPAHTA